MYFTILLLKGQLGGAVVPRGCSCLNCTNQAIVKTYWCS